MKTKSAVLLVAACLIVGGWTSQAMAKDMKTGYINLSQVFDSYEKTKTADADLQQKAEAKSAEREALVDSIKQMRDELEMLSTDMRAEKQAAIDEKVQELQAFDRDSRLVLRRERDAMIRDILKEIDEIVQKYGQDKGYDYIFNDRVLLFKKEQNDISAEITDLLNAK
ncbi:MAG: OmpH family outer membrane protein [Candidatus Omnitrophica bacterium]|nr:OmpH family outer membrane protein [Candidatus Omnitrophota bacterium]